MIVNNSEGDTNYNVSSDHHNIRYERILYKVELRNVYVFCPARCDYIVHACKISLGMQL